MTFCRNATVGVVIFKYVMPLSRQYDQGAYCDTPDMLLGLRILLTKSHRQVNSPREPIDIHNVTMQCRHVLVNIFRP